MDSDSLDTLALLTAAMDAAKWGNPPPDDVVAWMWEAVIQHVMEGVSTDAYLGLKTPHTKRNARYQYWLMRRNVFLYDLWKECGEPQTNTEYKSLGEQASRFQAGRWWHWREQGPPQNATSIQRLLFAAVNAAENCGGNIPTNPRRLREAIAVGRDMSMGYSCLDLCAELEGKENYEVCRADDK